MKKIKDEPRGRRENHFGRLKNGNPPCDLRALPRCQAKAKSTGKRCGNPAMKGKRVCYIHGGRSTGPKTKEGLERSKRANWKHGNYSEQATTRRKYVNELIRQSRELFEKM